MVEKPLVHSPEYSILVIGYRSLRFLRECFASLQATRYPAYEILFLDNDSPEAEADWVEKNSSDPRLRVFRSPHNLLFAGGVNFLAQRARGAFVILLNPDTRVDPDWLSVLAAARREGEWEAAQLDL